MQGAGAAVPFLPTLLDELRAADHDVTVRDVPYEFPSDVHAARLVR